MVGQEVKIPGGHIESLFHPVRHRSDDRQKMDSAYKEESQNPINPESTNPRNKKDVGEIQFQLPEDTTMKVVGMLSLSKRNYLGVIHQLCTDDQAFRTAEISAQLSVQKPSATEVLGEFVKWGLISKQGWGEWRVTNVGRAVCGIIATRRAFLHRFLDKVLKQPRNLWEKNGKLLEAALDALTIAGFADLYVAKEIDSSKNAEGFTKSVRKKATATQEKDAAQRLRVRPLSTLEIGETGSVYRMRKGFASSPLVAARGFLPKTPVIWLGSAYNCANKQGSYNVEIAGTTLSLEKCLAERLEVTTN